jgi:hypothetical protein
MTTELALTPDDHERYLVVKSTRMELAAKRLDICGAAPEHITRQVRPKTCFACSVTATHESTGDEITYFCEYHSQVARNVGFSCRELRN